MQSPGFIVARKKTESVFNAHSVTETLKREKDFSKQSDKSWRVRAIQDRKFNGVEIHRVRHDKTVSKRYTWNKRTEMFVRQRQRKWQQNEL